MCRRCSVRFLGVLVLVVALGATLSLAVGGAAARGNAGAIFRLGTTAGVDSPNPFVGATQDAYNTWEYIYPHLVQYGRGATVVPSFATSWRVTNRGRTWTFHTVANAKWSDGQPLTSKDVAWTYSIIRKYQQGATASWASYVRNMTHISAPNVDTVRISLSAPIGNMLDNVQGLPILPKHIWASQVGSGGAGLKTFTDPTPIVSGGPFVLTQFQANSLALFHRNAQYWGKAPTLLGFGLQVFSNPDALVTALQGGQLDGIESVPPTAVSALKKTNGIVVSQAPGLSESALFINLGASAPPELRNPLVRKALDYAINRRAMVSTVDLGRARPAASVIPFASGWADPDLGATPFKRAKANHILDKLGFKRAADGIRRAHGRKMAYTVLTVTSDPGIDVRFKILQKDFRGIGVALQERSGDGNAWFAAVTQKAKRGAGWSLAINSNTAVIDPTGFLAIFTCKSGFFVHSCKHAYDRAYTKAASATTTAARKKWIYRLERDVAHERLMITFEYINAIEAHSSSWTGFAMTGQGFFNQFSTQTMSHLHTR